MCDRLRKRVEVPVDDGAVRRRRLRARLYPVPRPARSARNGHGVRDGQSLAGQPRPYVSKAGKARPEVAYPRLSRPFRQSRADGLLHGRHRLDDVLLRAVPARQERRSRLRGHDHEPRRQHGLPAGRGRPRLPGAELRSAGRSRARHEISDGRAVSADARPRRAQRHALRRRQGSELLSGAGLLQDRRLGHRRRHEPGLLLAEPRHRLAASAA